MAANFYFQFDGAPSAIDIEQSYGIRVTSVRGLHPADPKEIFTRDWADENGVDVYIPATRKVKSTEVTMTCFAENGTLETAIEKYDRFCESIITDAPILYWDTLQNQQVSLIYTGNKPVWYQFVAPTRLMFEITFLNATGTRTAL